MKKAIIMGASSGIGHEVARLLINEGWTVGVAARRIEKLTDLQNSAPERVFTAQIDVTEEHADASLSALITRMDGIDIYLHVAGIGWQNPSLEPEKEIKTMETNATGFTRMVGEAYRYFAHRLYHFYSRNKGSWTCSSIQCYESFAEHLPTGFGTIIAH